MRKWIVVGGVALASLMFGAILYTAFTRGTIADSVEVTWDLLGQMDYITGKASPELDNLNNKMVRIPGFMVPLEDQAQKVAEFLLVPTPQACIHVPPPPSNQMVYIKMKDPVESAFGPIWVYGYLRLVTKKHMYGEASFEVDAVAIEPYR